MTELKKTFRFRLYPTRRQAALLEEQLAECARLYNAALEERRAAYKKGFKAPSVYDQTREWTQVRADGSTSLVHYKLGQDVLQRVDRAFEGFFRRVRAGEKPGYPRWKSRRRYDSMTYINYGKRPQVDGKGKLILKGIGHVKVRWHRPIDGVTKTCTIKREANRWYVSFSVEIAPEPLPPSDEVVGLDMGVEVFLMRSDGQAVEHPRYLRQAQAQLARAQRRVARRRKGSHRRRKAVMMLQRAWMHVRHQRRHFHHVKARKLVDQYGLIAVEDLKIRNMTGSAKGTAEHPGSRVRQKAGLNRAILDAAWGQFLNILRAKAAEAGRVIVDVDARGTSQRCPCGAPNPKRLKDRWHTCQVCGLSVSRDHASALEILRLGRLSAA